MALSSSELAELNRLIEVALQLPADERGTWLCSLPESKLKGRLAQALAIHNGGAVTSPVLDTLPKIDCAGIEDDTVARAGLQVGPYRLVSQLGVGGMGVVWLAEQTDGRLRRKVALKLPRLAWGSGLAERMARERDIGAMLEHPNIARLYDAGVDLRGRPYLAFEHVDGSSIDAWCDEKSLSIRDRLMLFVPVVRAVAYAHRRHIVHRDIKPSNVLIDANGRAHLLDFGIAKLLSDDGSQDPSGPTLAGGRALTPSYAAPEQLRGEDVTTAADIYSLGVMLHKLLTAHLPQREVPRAKATLPAETVPASSRVSDRRIAATLRGEIDAILAKALHPDPALRYGSADALADDVERHLDGQVVLARPRSAWYHTSKWIVRHRIGVAAAAAVLLTSSTAATLAMLQVHRASRQLERTQLVTAFVSDLFRSNAVLSLRPTPPPARGDSFLNTGARMIEARFRDQPDLQADLFGAIGRIYLDLGAGPSAINYSQRQIALLETLPPDRYKRSKALQQMAQAYFIGGRLVEAEKQARRAVTEAGKQEPHRSEATVLLARLLFENGNIGEAGSITASLETRARDESDLSRATLAKMHFVRALLLRRARAAPSVHVQELRRAAELARRSEDPLSDSSIEIQLALAKSLSMFGEATRAEGRALIDTVLAALRSTGDVGEVKAALRSLELHQFLFESVGADYASVLPAIELARSTLERHALSVPPEARAEAICTSPRSTSSGVNT